METNVVFEQKISIGPREFNSLGATKLDEILLKRFEAENSARCSVHGWVKPGTMKMLSRSMMQIEGGRFTGDMVCWVQVEGTVIYPVDGMRIQGTVMKKNKMGLFVMHDEAIQVMVPRDLNIGTSEKAVEFDSVQIGEMVEVEVKKSRFQVRDPTILSVGLFIRRLGRGAPIVPAAAAAPAKMVDQEEEESQPSEVEEMAEEAEAEEEEEDEAAEEIDLSNVLTGEEMPPLEAIEDDENDAGTDKIQLRE
jgi:hypothetical protein